MTSALIGICLLLGALWLLGHVVGNPLDELALIRRAEVASCTLGETYEGEQESERGHVHTFDVGVYAFTTRDGREFKTLTKAPTGQCAAEETVEYLPENPEINRVRGDGCSSVAEWIWRKIGLGTVLLVLFASPGVVMLREAVRDMRRLRSLSPAA